MIDTAAEHAHQSMMNFHKKCFETLGPRTEVLWKGGVRSQEHRFEQLLRVLPGPSHLRLLDVGCGFGDLLGFLERDGRSVDYTGVDLCEEMIAESRKRHPEARFLAGPFLDMRFDPGEFDVVVASGLFNFPNPDWNGYVVGTVKRMLSVSRELVAVNFLSSFSQQPSEDSYYAHPARTLDMLMTEVSPWAVLIHDYRWNDFTIALRSEMRTGV